MNDMDRVTFLSALRAAVDNLRTARDRTTKGYDLDDRGAAIDHAEAAGALALLERAVANLAAQ
jgi:hypothetical protein